MEVLRDVDEDSTAVPVVAADSVLIGRLVVTAVPVPSGTPVPIEEVLLAMMLVPVPREASTAAAAKRVSFQCMVKSTRMIR